jgi:hypothetical protein
VNIFKKIKIYRQYRNSLSKIERELSAQFNVRIDNVGRLYTVLNIPEEIFEEPYNIRKSDIDAIAQNYIKDYSSKLSTFLNKNDLIELYDFYSIEKVEKYSYLLILGFSLMNTEKFFKRLYFRFIPITSIILLTILFFLIF